MTPADVLREALARLDGGRLWVKGARNLIPGERLCAWIALNPSGGFVDENDRAQGRAARVLTDALPHGYAGYRSVIRYNDDPATKWPDIEALYHRAIKLAEEEQG